MQKQKTQRHHLRKQNKNGMSRAIVILSHLGRAKERDLEHELGQLRDLALDLVTGAQVLPPTAINACGCF